MKQLFAQRLPADLSESPLQQQLQAVANAVDLTESNPTRCGFKYPVVDETLLGPRTWAYEPDPQGTLAARTALGEALHLDPDNLILTASTSEAYSMVFKLLCDPGDAVAAGAPSYPLVQHLAELDVVQTHLYYWIYESGRWALDLHSVELALDHGVRALVLITPNNPTGSCPRPHEIAELAAMCNARGVVLVVDEVFAPYRSTPADGFEWAAFERCLVFNGLSKAAALPQLKLGWISVHGDPAWVAAARERLIWIADTYLSVSTPVQVALPALLAAAPALQAQIRARLAENRATLARLLSDVPTVDLLNSDGGWYGVLRVPQRFSEDELVVRVLREAGAKLHPGYFYELPSNGYLVTGLLNPPEAFAPAWRRICSVLDKAFS